MEPNRYWFLYFGLLFLFLSSKVGKMSFFLVFDFLRAGFFLTLALLAAIASKACWVVGVLLFRLGASIKAKREASAADDEKWRKDDFQRMGERGGVMQDFGNSQLFSEMKRSWRT